MTKYSISSEHLWNPNIVSSAQSLILG